MNDLKDLKDNPPNLGQEIYLYDNTVKGYETKVVYDESLQGIIKRSGDRYTHWIPAEEMK